MIQNSIKKYHNYLGKLRARFYNQPIGLIKFIMNKNKTIIQREPISNILKKELIHEFETTINDMENILNIELSNWKLI